YAYYDDVSGVQVGTPVKISGVTVGSVSARDLSVEDRRVKLTFNLTREVPLPKDTRAILATTSALGDMAIIFDYAQPCQGANCAESGDTFEGRTQGMIESFLGEGGLESYIQQLKEGMQDVVNTLNKEVLGDEATGPLAESMRDLQSTMGNLKAATGRVNTLLQRSSPELEASLSNVAALTGTLEEQKGAIAGIIANADSLSAQLVAADLEEAVVQAKATIEELNATLASAKTAMGGVNDIVGNLQEGQGTLGLLLQDQGLYNNLNQLSYSLDSVLTDLQDKPYRYLPLKSRRKVQKYDRQDAAAGN
ncbi:MAG: MlaD family protein, partial [Bacteroidota bacterium]